MSIDLQLPARAIRAVLTMTADEWIDGFKSFSIERVKPACIFGFGFIAMQFMFKFAQQYMEARRARAAAAAYGKPKAPTRRRSKWAGLWLLGGLASVTACVLGLCYYNYGPLFFVNGDQKMLSLSAAEWGAILETRTVALVGGHHRAGTTALWRAVAQHPAIASFGEQRECGLDFSEGIFAQDVYPRFGIGDVQGDNPIMYFLGQSEKKGRGRGRSREVRARKCTRRLLDREPLHGVQREPGARP
mmetsp:Transcript_25389/g.79221  ORF Transcript_25389/g.79221 Transcript_25389/m.79221 type:complete len:245 (-) Transcript_25389:726-1460(-)